MKDEFYEKPTLEGIWEKCTFVFDTSILMNLYTYPEEIYDEFINILENEVPDRIWMPYQFNLEFQRNSVHGVERAAKNYENLKSTITSLMDDSKNLAQKIMDLNQVFNNSKINNTIKENFNEIDAILENMSVSLIKPSYNNDKIKNKLNSLFEGKTGDNYPDSRLNEINNEAKIRSIKGINPGFEENEYSNLISWYQILDHAKEEKNDIIFVTENPDWWINREKELIEPHPSLLKKFSDIGQEFHIYKLNDFLKCSKEYLNIKSKIDKTNVIEELVDFSNKLKERKSTKLENPPSDIALQEIIDNTLLGESALQKLINQSTAYSTIQNLIDQKVIDESELHQMITRTLLSESELQKLINQNTSYGTLQKLIDQKVIDEIDLQKMITRTVMSESVLQKLIDQNTTTKNALEEALRKRTNKK
ncbi:PIN-like domain-containing protein [Methanobacterium sp.]|uniref:PIN-like domain-containing protein n=1 Tax=Methanobacterium sp. TaxID=2164 RepID=UPI003C773250